MVTKKKQSTTDKRGKKKVNELKLNKETVKDLTDSEADGVKGGALAHGDTTIYSCGPTCKNTCENCTAATCLCVSKGSLGCCDTDALRCPKMA